MPVNPAKQPPGAPRHELTATAAQRAHRKKERVPAVRRDLERKKERFLELVADGQPVIRATAEAGLGRRTVYDWRSQDPGFAAAWDEAYEQGTDRLELEAQERALNGSDLLLQLLPIRGQLPAQDGRAEAA
jgi:hypothetical protein